MKNYQQHSNESENVEFQKLSDEELWLAASLADEGHRYDVNKAFDRWKMRTGMAGVVSRRVRRLKMWGAAAAAVLVLGMVSVTAYWQGERNVRGSFADIVVEAPLGSKTRLLLPDGSLVWLNAGSKLVYSQGFGVVNRSLSFEGEGYFEVQKNAELPFVVRTSDLNVKVLGTKFNFRNYQEDLEAVVDLLEGKVALESHLDPDHVGYLAPSEKMVLDKRTGNMRITKAKEVKESIVWTDNVLRFDEELLPVIAQRLERIYNVKIKIKNAKLNDIRFYGIFDQSKQNVYDVLNSFAGTGNFEYSEENGVIYLK